MSSRLVIKDAARQLIWRLISALFWFLTIKIMTPYLGPLRYGDYSTILKYFAIRTALADLGLYVLAIKRLWEIKEKDPDPEQKTLKSEYGKFVWTRLIIMIVIYTIALIVAYCLPVYTSNPYLVRWLPLWMIFSASFMFAGIQQLPLQIFWQMKQLSYSLITARLSQILVLVPVVYLFFRNINFTGDPTNISIIAFCLIIFSVVASGIWQNLEIHRRAKRILPLKIDFDRKFTKEIIIRNRKYWVSYYLSSFHTLIVLLFLWRYFPTAGWLDLTGIWALSLSLIEILLIIPSSLWNSLLHKITGYSEQNKRKSIWNLMLMMIRIWSIVAINFRIFSTPIIEFIWWKEFLWTLWLFRDRWSDQVLPFLWIVLLWSFIKQVYNYLFVAVDKQNYLLRINLFWVAIWVIIWVITIPKRWLGWGVITQTIIEFLFVLWAIFVGTRHKVNPIIPKKLLYKIISILVWFSVLWFILAHYITFNVRTFFIWWAIFNWILVLISFKTIKKIARWLAIEESVENADITIDQ